MMELTSVVLENGYPVIPHRIPGYPGHYCPPPTYENGIRKSDYHPTGLIQVDLEDYYFRNWDVRRYYIIEEMRVVYGRFRGEPADFLGVFPPPDRFCPVPVIAMGLRPGMEPLEIPTAAEIYRLYPRRTLEARGLLHLLREVQHG